MKKWSIIILLFFCPLCLCAQNSDLKTTWTQSWEKQFSTASDIINVYRQNSRNNPQSLLLNNCFMVQKSGEYILASKGEAADIPKLVKEIPDIDLENSVTRDFMANRQEDLFADFYFMLKAMKQGVVFNEARDGIGFSTTFPERPLNLYDYAKLHQVLSGKNEKLKCLYLERLELIIKNRGCSDELMELKPIIQKQAANSDIKEEILTLYAKYERLRKGKPAPHSIFKDANGKEYSFKDFRGKVIVVDIWATWCHWCLKKMPDFMKLRDEYRGNNNVIFLAVSVDRADLREKWLKAIQDHKMDKMLNLIKSSGDETDFEKNYQVIGIPRYLLIDHQGNIINAFIRSVGAELKADIEKALAAVAPIGGTEWQNISLREALEKSAATGKKVFIDCYTKTCTPCKYMVKTIFPLKECGDYFNSNYICLMRDMQEGEGVEIGRKYKIGMYPTYLILNADGSEYCHLMGGVSSPEEDFVGRVKEVVLLTEHKKRYNSGLREEAFLKEYIELMQKHDPNQLEKVMNELMPSMGVTRLCESENWKLMKSVITTPNLPLFEYLLKNRKAFEKRLGKEEVQKQIILSYNNEFRMYRNNKIDVDKRIAEFNKLEKQGVKGITPLKYSMIIGHIIGNSLRERTDEILDILKDGVSKLPSEQDQVAVVREVIHLGNIATHSQKQQAIAYLEQISKQISPNNINTFKRVIEHLSQN